MNMLTYSLADDDGPLYKSLYSHIKQDIYEGRLKSNEKMPSKRTFAKNLGVSTITVENAYDQLIEEGYMYAVSKKGYFIADITDIAKTKTLVQPSLNIETHEKKEDIEFDFSSNRTESVNFPFSVWAKLMRSVISERKQELLEMPFCGGVEELRNAIASHLFHFRGMTVDKNQIIVGAGTEYLYGLLVKLLGRDSIYCIENPGYKKLKQVYDSNYIRCYFADMDSDGIKTDELRKVNADIVHISPTHHFPTGITMPVSRRYELLAWANESDSRYIIEDDYDSEFRIKGKPIPTLQSIDACGKVIYINTFSKSLTSTIRISYMVLPEKLANRFYEKMSFYSNTVSTFEQYTLAEFISQGYFEKHINRMRLHYGRKRTQIFNIIKNNFDKDECQIIENDSGLHFLLQIKTNYSDREIKERLLENHIKIAAITDYEYGEEIKDKHQFILNYSNLDIAGLDAALKQLKMIM